MASAPCQGIEGHLFVESHKRAQPFDQRGDIARDFHADQKVHIPRGSRDSVGTRRDSPDRHELNARRLGCFNHTDSQIFEFQGMGTPDFE